ncbi:MAG: AIPR family protein [Candidatus Brocadia sp.]|jgi:AIPR protein.|uniref:Phage protein n=1 Tax=Candidatus Brocadia fulgida TaxID=380242 RepID=A0A0M2V012_9BACT|nr:MAG: putative phage protein [Candidatus Brocadia fulgida]UJS19657.1 MAG: AIPR family protein [Candidatus Brocadia sp.]
MSDLIENTELKRFYQSLIQDLKSTQVSEEEGGILEQIFTQTAVDLLADAGETENARVAHDEGHLGTKNQHKINAYAEPDNYETIDLFITIYKGKDEPTRLAKEEINTAAKRITNFFRKAKCKDYVNEIEESSQIFDFAHMLSTSEDLTDNLVRVNAIILTDGLYQGEYPENQNIAGYPIFFRVIDLAYLYNITEKSHIPIEIDFTRDGFEIPCIISPSENDQYQSYLAIISGTALATIYERYGSRLLEQNVRSFLQFTGKINKGMRKTINEEPHMFLAFNNGIAVTAEEIEITKSEDGKGYLISKVKDFQIVNGGQTTASIYHTFKKDKADISGVFVQVKLTVVKNRNDFSKIVSRISEYANTQNKVSVSDLSSNIPYHIELEKLSRTIFTPHVTGQINQTRWFYERARGQYKNARIKEGFTKAKQKAFDLKNPKKQMFNKEDLAKYVNAYRENYDGNKLRIGPHLVVLGNQKNYAQFLNNNLIDKPDNIYFEDIVSKAILFRTAEKLYGVKPNAIGDLRYITVPYTISLLGYLTEYKLDLYKIWTNQSISEGLQSTLRDLMRLVENFIKNSAPGALFGEWGKKQDCWFTMKEEFKNTPIPISPEDLVNPETRPRRRISDTEVENSNFKEIEATIKNISTQKWKVICQYCKENDEIPDYFTNAVHNLRRKLKEGIRPTSKEILLVDELLNKIIYKTSIFDEE